MSVAVCPGSFDPPTLGHLDIIRRAAAMFEQVYVVVVINSAKTPLLPPEDRVKLLQECTVDLPGVTVESFDGLLADYARQKQACTLVKGVRNSEDFTYEQGLSQVNRHLCNTLDTVLFCADPAHNYISSTVVKEMLRYGQELSGMVPAPVCRRLAALTMPGINNDRKGK